MADASLSGMAQPGGFQADPNASPTDPTYVAKFVQYLSTLPGADLSLAADPNYWVQKIIETGGATNAVAGKDPGQGQNIDYWTGRSKAGAGDSSGGGGGGASPYGNNGYAGSPGYAFEQQAANNAVQASAAARGTLLTTGTLKDLQQTAAGVAGQAFGLDTTNLTNLANIGQNANANVAGLQTGAANAQAAGQVGSGNAWQGGLTGISNAAQTAGQYLQAKNLISSLPAGK